MQLTHKKRNRKAIIITAAAMLTGILLILAGFFGGSVIALFNKGFDLMKITNEDLGKEISSDIEVEFDNLDLTDKATQMIGNPQGDYGVDNKTITLDFSHAKEDDERLYFSSIKQHVTIQGTIRALEDTEYNEIAEEFYKRYDYIYYRNIENGTWSSDVKLEDFRKMILEPVLPYCIDVTSVSAFNWYRFIPAGIVIFLISLLLEICFVFKLRKRIVLPIVFGIAVIVPAILFFNHIRAMLTIKKAGDGLYTMKNLECTDTQGMLDSGSSSVNELLEWILDKHFYGMPNIFESQFSFGCSAFAATTPEGDHLFGRNFDYPETDTLLVYSHPEGCYESIGIADLGILGVGPTYPVSSDSIPGRLIMIMTPYYVVDGMNEKGVGAGILQLNIEETHQDNGKPDLLVFCAVRAILDKCASVDEALELLDSYDIHSDTKTDYHLFITDRFGRYVVVEWLDGEMVTVEQPCCTNSVIAPGEHYNQGLPDNRLPDMEKCLGASRVVTESEAMVILDKVQTKNLTEWSCVYNLDDFTVNICLDADYEKVYTFSALGG